MSKGKIILLTIAIVFCVAINAWWGVVLGFGDEKIVSNTVNLDMMETQAGDKATFMEINYLSNENNNGLEMLEVKLNGFTDETQNNFTSVGLQFVADTQEDAISFKDNLKQYNLIKTEKYGFLNGSVRNYYNIFHVKSIGDNSSYFEYQSSNDYDYSIGNSINPLNINSAFKVTVTAEDGTTDMFRLTFRGAEPDEDFFLYQYNTEAGYFAAYEEYQYHYDYVDYNLLASKIYEAVKNSTYASSTYELLQFSNFFNYEKYNGDTYSSIEESETEMVKQEIINNYVVKVSVSKDGAKMATDSMFNQVQGNASFKISEDLEDVDFVYGKSIIELTEKDFELVQVIDNYYALKLRTEFVEVFKSYKDTILLDIEIDLDYLNGKGIELYGILKEEGINIFNVLEMSTFKTVGGVITEGGCVYA